VYGPVRTVVWQGSPGDRRPYADQHRIAAAETIHFLRMHNGSQDTRRQASQELANLDCLRSFAVTAVLVDHWSLMHRARVAGTWQNAFGINLGFVGVIAFFIHTSFVLMLSLKRMNALSGSVSVPFYIRRIFRIYPLSILTILGVLLFRIPDLPVLGSHFVAPSPRVALANLLLIQNLIGHASVLGPLWSLPFEIEMYVALPALFLVAVRPRGPRSIALVFMCFTALGCGLMKFTGHASILAYVPCFLSGVFAFTLRGKVRPVLPAIFWPLTLGVWFVTFPQLITAWGGAKDIVIQGVMCFALASSLNYFRDSNISSLNLATATIAKYSYGIYLTHFPMMWIVRDLWAGNELLGTVAWLVLTAIASVLLYYLLEAPMINLGKSIADRYPRRRRALRGRPEPARR
jgi:peptidoglycan/LPS O-acetylase OafA/YrhL